MTCVLRRTTPCRSDQFAVETQRKIGKKKKKKKNPQTREGESKEREGKEGGNGDKLRTFSPKSDLQKSKKISQEDGEKITQGLMRASIS